MSFEPISIFSHRIDPQGVVKLLRATGAVVEVSGTDDNWSQVVVQFAKKGLFRKARVLTFGHNEEYDDGPNWPRQVAGMQGYFSNFPDCPAKSLVMQLIRSFRFSLSVPQYDLDINGNDDRLALVCAVCRYLDGAIFTPSSLRDAEGRILLNLEGYSDPNAVFPKLPPTDDHPEATIDHPEAEEDDNELR